MTDKWIERGHIEYIKKKTLWQTNIERGNDGVNKEDAKEKGVEIKEKEKGEQKLKSGRRKRKH